MRYVSADGHFIGACHSAAAVPAGLGHQKQQQCLKTNKQKTTTVKTIKWYQHCSWAEHVHSDRFLQTHFLALLTTPGGW